MLAFTTDDFKTVFRNEVSDVVASYLWSDPEIYTYMTEAFDAVSKGVEGRFKAFQFAITPAAQVNPPALVPITLPRSILHIREAKLLTLGYNIEPSQSDHHVFASYDTYGPTIRNSAKYSYGIPTEWIRDYYNNALYLVPIPTVTDTLELQCSITVGVPQTAGMPMPFFDTEDQRLALHYMKYLAYSKQDADTVDMGRAKEFYALFKDGAKEREVKLRSYRRRPGQIVMEW